MKQLIGFLAISLFFLGTVSCSNDDDAAPDPNVTFTATMSGASEVPPNASTATGTATLLFNTTTKIFTFSATYSGVTAIGAHIHKAEAGTIGDVVFPLDPIASPINFTSTALDAAQETDLNADLYYINIHSADFPGGEIRGQLIKQ